MLQDDVSATLDESRWFVADEHIEELKGYMASWKGNRWLHLIDLFGYKTKLTRVWSERGYQAQAYDVLLGGRAHDLLSKRGFLFLTRDLLCFCIFLYIFVYVPLFFFQN